MRSLALLLAATACTTEAPPPAPLVSIVPDSAGPHVEYDQGLAAWARLGFTPGDNGVECPRDWYVAGEVDCTITIYIALWPQFKERYGHDALTDRATRGVIIDDRYSGRLLVHLAAHEIGHVLLDTGHLQPGQVGIMSGEGLTETKAWPADYELACESIGYCVSP